MDFLEKFEELHEQQVAELDDARSKLAVEVASMEVVDNPRNRGDPTCTEFGNGPFLGDLGTVLGVVLGVVLGRPEARFF
jgi:hypothetical protein